MSQQLPLPIAINNEETLDDFVWGDNLLIQQQLTLCLQHLGERMLYLWGDNGLGKTHLLQAACHEVTQHQEMAIYLPLKLLHTWDTSLLEGLEHHSLIAIDDVEAIGNNRVWEEALFHLYNRVKENESCRLIFSASEPPNALDFSLPDLRSRLNHTLIMHLQTLKDEDKIQLLCVIANKRGLTLTPQISEYLVTRLSRNLNNLIQVLDKLDAASLAHKRKLTIPFVKSILDL